MVLDFFFKERRLIQYDKHIFTIYMYHFLQFIYMYIHVKNWHLGNLHTYTLILWLEYIPTYTEIFKNCVYTLYISYLIGISFICLLRWLYIIYFESFVYFWNIFKIYCLIAWTINYMTQIQNFSEIEVLWCFFSKLLDFVKYFPVGLLLIYSCTTFVLSFGPTVCFYNIIVLHMLWLRKIKDVYIIRTGFLVVRIF